MTDRQRNGLILLFVAGLLIVSGLFIATKKTFLGLDLQGGVELVYQGEPTKQSAVTPDALARAVDIMRNRVDQLGVAEPSIQTSGKTLIDVQLPDVSNVARAEQEVGSTARLEFYDWEANALVTSGTGAGKPVASQLEVQDQVAQEISQGSASGPGSPGSGSLDLYQAAQLASKQPASSSANNARIGNEYYVFGAPGSAACATAAKDQGTAPVPGVHCLLTQGNSPVDLLANVTGSTLQSDLQQDMLPGITVSQGQTIVVKEGTVILEAAPVSASSQVKFGAPTAQYYVLKDNVALFGKDVTNPQQSTDPDSGEPDVEFGFNSAGASTFARITAQIAARGREVSIGAQHYYQHFAVALDNQLLTVPQIDYNTYPDGITGGGGADITGGFTITSAQQLATNLRLGALPINLKLISEEQVSASLGKQALNQGLLAGIAGLAIVALFLLFFYRVLGLIAVGGLAIYGVYYYALIKLIPITMTLAGIAGLILTIGVAADANIVIFERVKEEIRAGRQIRQGIITGYRKGLTAIIDANVVTIMTAFILFVLATADVKGFAFTLGIGTFASLFTAVLATQAILMTMGDSRVISSPSALGAGGKKRVWRYDFMGASRYFFTMSGMILLIGALAVGGRGLNLGIDFTSGTQISVGLQHQASVAQVRSVMQTVNAGDATIQAVTHDKTLGRYGFQISSKFLDRAQFDTVRGDLSSRFGIATTASGNQDFNNTSVGPTFGSDVAHSAVIAIIASLLVITLYITLRFDWKYAVPVLIALMHDLLITSGVYALTGRVVTTDTVAALLTILGYSLYDTIIVFDRVRENVPRMPRAAFSQIVNRSMSEVLTRSLATTSCTLLPVVALLLFGGTTLKDFAFALLIGVASGAYSSIFIASPVLTHWKEREAHYRNRRDHIIADLGHVPAYADRGEDVDPDAPRSRRTGRLTTPDPDGVSGAEFEQMKRDLGLEEEAPARRMSAFTKRVSHHKDDETDEGAPQVSGTGTRRGLPQRPQAQRPLPQRPGGKGPAVRPQAPSQPGPSEPVSNQAPASGEVAPAPDLAENDGVARTPEKPRQRSRQRNRRHGRK
jgi:SecD/SecF fusion protein